MHVVVIGCGRVGSELAGALQHAGHSVAVVDKNARAFRRLGPDFARQDRRRLRLRPRPPRPGRHRRGRSFRLCDERRQLQHPLRPHRPRDLRHRARRRPDLRPAPRPHLPTPRASRPSPPSRGRPTRCCGGCCPGETSHDWVDPTGRIGLVERTIPAKAIGQKLAKLNRPGRFWLTAVTRFGKAQVVTSDLIGQEGDVLVFVSDMDGLDELQKHIESGGGD